MGEGPSKQTDRTDGGWVQSTVGAKTEQIKQKLKFGLISMLFRFFFPGFEGQGFNFWVQKAKF